MKSLHLAILIDQLAPGGVQKTAIYEAKEFIKLGHTVTLFVLIRRKFDYQYEDITKGIQIVYLSNFNPFMFRRALKIPFFSFLTHLHLLNPWFVGNYKFIKNYDYLISHGTTTCITASALARKYKIPYLAVIWDPLVFILEKVYSSHPLLKLLLPVIKPFVQNLERDFLLTASLVATTSKVHQDFIKNNYHMTPFIIHPGCEILQKVNSKPGAYVLGYTRWQLAKNPQFFLKLAQKLPQLNFLIAGKWPEKEEEQTFISEIRKLKLEKKVKLFPLVKADDLPSLARQSFVWVHPHFEAFGMAGLEMAGQGLPLILPQGSGVTELFIHGVHGFFPKTLNLTEYVRHIKYLSSHPEQSKKMGDLAQKICRKFSWANHTKLLNECISTSLSQTQIVCLNNAYVSTRSLGGGEYFLFELIKRAPRSVNITIITPPIGLYHWQKFPLPHNVRFVTLFTTPFDGFEWPPLIASAYLIRALLTLFLLPHLPEFTSLHTPTDLISDVFPAYIRRRLSKSTYWTARFFHFYEQPQKREGSVIINFGSYFLQRISLRLMKSADTIMIDNPLIIKKLAAAGYTKQQLEFHPGGVDLKLFQSGTLTGKIPQTAALFIGRIAPHKGVYDCVNVWQEVVKELANAKLGIIGYGPQEVVHQLNRIIQDANMQDSISYFGFVHERITLAQYLLHTKLLLFLDHEAGFGLVVVEAMAAGKPVIAYDLPIFAKLYHQGVTTVPFKNFSAMAKVIVKLLTQNDKYQRLSQAAVNEAVKYDWQKVSYRFYKSLTNPL